MTYHYNAYIHKYLEFSNLIIVVTCNDTFFKKIYTKKIKTAPVLPKIYNEFHKESNLLSSCTHIHYYEEEKPVL